MTAEETPSTAASWNATLAPFKQPVLAKSLWQLASTTVLLAANVVLMYLSLDVGYWLTLVLAVPGAFLLIRLFIFQHDCGHGAFFASTGAANVVGAVIGVLTLTPYAYWRRAHALHHATSGNLDHRGFGDIDTLTVGEYLARDRWGRFKYRVYRHPLSLFVIGAQFHFFIRHRWPGIVPREWRRERRSILWTNLGVAALIGAGCLALGPATFLKLYLPMMMMSCSLGVWLFYVQHQFEPTYWEHDEQWEFVSAALDGSSYYELPAVLQWLTGNIGLHHVHHLNSRIPNYHLQKVFDTHPELHRVTRISLWQSLRCMSLALWDESERKLIPFSRVAAAST